MKKMLSAIGMMFCLPLFIYAQSDEDALRFSQYTIGGTARFVGVGGAFGALGADFGSLSFNPAGIGLYRSSEMSFSASVAWTNSTSNFQNILNNASASKFNVSNFGVVFSSDLTRKQIDNKWKRLNFGFGANRTNDFNKSTYYRGFNEDNSLIDTYLQELNAGGGIAPSQITNTYPFSSALAWESYLVNPDVSDTNFYSSVIPHGQVMQDKLIEEDGSATEYVFTLGSNYDDKLFIGATFGMPSLHYTSTSSYVETDVNNSISNFSNFQLYDNVSSYGIGFNGKFGLAYRVNDWVRFGGAFHSPTIYYLHDEYSSYINAQLDTTQGDSYSTPYGVYDYALVTPWRAIASMAIFFKQYGFISVDYEFMDYASMHYNFNKYAPSGEQAIESSINQSIKLKYGSASNIRVGGELVYDIFRFRAGFGYYGSPFKPGVATEDYDYSKINISGGFGIKLDKVSIDAAYIHTSTKQFYQPYSLDSQFVPGVGINNNSGNVVVSLAYKF
ncbi:MAG: hypothetical protein IPO83_13560 [Chitinophagaceae bacterium]|nr:hypothetical protein [Chitinophagaceae bacterium]